MKAILGFLMSLMIATALAASPFTAIKSEEAYGVVSFAWRFESNLSKEASGVIEVCYAEGDVVRVLGKVDVRPFRSSREKMPDLRILFTKADVDGAKKVVLLVGYGLRSGVFVVDVPGLTTHSLAGAGMPEPDDSGSFTLLGFGDAVRTKANRLENTKGRLFFRYVEKPNLESPVSP